MAYAVHLLSVAEALVRSFQSHESSLRPFSKATTCSHLLAHWVEVQPLGRYLEQALDGGETLRDDLQHPFRVPNWWSAWEVAQRSPQLSAAWEEMVNSQLIPDPEDWYRFEVTRVVDLFAHACAHGEAIIKIMEHTVFPKEG